MKNVVLIGMPGSGKSTFGRAAARLLHRPFVDCDDFIEEMEGRTIPELFAVSEACFRDAETRAARLLARREGAVIAAGGGFVKRAENVALLRPSSAILFLDRAPEAIAGDVAVAGRPLLAEGPQKVFALYEERIALYRAAADRTVMNRGSEADVLRAVTEAVRTLMSLDGKIYEK